MEEWESPPLDKAAKAQKTAWLRKFAVGYVGVRFLVFATFLMSFLTRLLCVIRGLSFTNVGELTCLSEV